MPSNLLVVDVGNTNIVLGVYANDELLHSWRLSTARDRTADEYGILARELIGASARQLEGTIVSSVVPPVNHTIAEMVRKYFGHEALFVEPGIKTGLSIHIQNPLEVGADRIVNAVAAFDRFGGPSVVVDFGTATTFDVVSAEATYEGGIIAPGLDIAAEALFSRAARLPRVDIRKPAHLIGTSTVGSMQSGIYYGYAGLVDGILTRMKRELTGLKRIVATGGYAALMAEVSQHIDEVDEELTLKGLKLVWDRNQKPRGRRR